MTGMLDADIDHPEAISFASGKLQNGVIVAVLDTGILYNHPDLKNNMWNGENCISDTGATMGGCMHGYDFAYGDKDPQDGHYHGTHVAGTIGAISNNGTGVVWVATNVKLMAVKVLDDEGYGDTASIIRGIYFAQKNGAKVINASLGIIQTVNQKSDFDLLMYNAIGSFSGLFIAAAGNAGTDFADEPNTKNYPSGFWSDTVVSWEVVIDNELVYSGSEIIPALANVISVAASDQNDELTYFSNYGIWVHIAAPWENIYSAIPISNVISWEISELSLSSGWTRQSNAASGTWQTRSNIVVSGEDIDLSGALWWDTRDPYVSGEAAYIQKTFSRPHGPLSNIKMGVWCDTPQHTYPIGDYLEVLISTWGLYTKIAKIDETRLWWYGTQASVNGYEWYFANYFLPIPGIQDIGWDFSIRIRWRSDAMDDLENGVRNYGCAVKNLSVYEKWDQYGYDYLDGTSMASPHVAGAAALAWQYKPNANPTDIRNAIVNSVDRKPTYMGKVLSQGRLNALNMLEYLDYLENPIPNISHESRVFRESLNITLSGEASFYSSGTQNKVRYEISKDTMNNGTFTSIASWATYNPINYSMSWASYKIEYYGITSSGIRLTATQAREYIYDDSIPTISHDVINNIGWRFSVPATLSIRDATVAPPSSRIIYASADIEIWRFGLTSGGENTNLRKFTLTNTATASGVTDFRSIISANSVRLLDVATNNQILATVVVNTGSIIFDNMSIDILKDTTRNFKIVASTSPFGIIEHDKRIDLGITINTADKYSGGSASLNPGSLMSLASTDYVVGITPPTMSITKKSARVFLVAITNIDTESNLTLNAIKAQIKLAPANNSTYTANYCLRAEGSSVSTCPTDSTLSTTVGAIPWPSTNLVIANPFPIPKNSSLSYEILVDSNFIDTTDLSLTVDEITYNGNKRESYVGGTWNSDTGASSTGGNIITNNFTTSTDIYYLTGSQARISSLIWDDTLNFSSSGQSILSSALAWLENPNIIYDSIGNYGKFAQAYGNITLTGAGRRDITYSLTDLVGNTTEKSLILYRLPAISGTVLTQTWGQMILSWQADMMTPVEITYGSWSNTGSLTFTGVMGANTYTLPANIALTGSIQVTIGIPRLLSGLTLPDTVYAALKTTKTYIVDSIPDGVTFASQVGITPGMSVIYGPVILTGFNVPVIITTTRGTIGLTGGRNSTGSIVAYPWDSMTFTLIAPSIYNTRMTGSLSVGAVPVFYSLETSLSAVPPIVQNPTAGPGGGGWSSAFIGSPLMFTPAGVTSPAANDSSRWARTPIENFKRWTPLESLFSQQDPIMKMMRVDREKATLSPNTFTKIYVLTPLVDSIEAMDLSTTEKKKEYGKIIDALDSRITSIPAWYDKRVLIHTRFQLKQKIRSLR
jgi:subtilisin family serine protease